MNLDDKTANALSAADLAGQTREPVPAKSAKRRKPNGGNGAASRKAKKAVVETEEFDDNSAALTLAPTNGGAKQRKKMLFEPVDAGAPPSIALMGGNGHGAVDPSIFSAAEAATEQKPEPAQKIVVPAVSKSVSSEEHVAVALSDHPAGPVTRVAEAVESAAASEPVAPVAEMKGSVFQVATLVMRSSEASQAEVVPSVAPQPEIESPVDDGGEIVFAPAETATATPAAIDPMVGEIDIPTQPAATQSAPVKTLQTEPTSKPVIAVEPASPVKDSSSSQPTIVAAAPSLQPEAAVQDKAPAAMSRFQAIAARAARMSAQSSARPAVQPQQTAPAPRTPEPPRSPELPVQAGDIYGYWSRVKNGRRFPSRSDFDAEQLAEHWPNSMLLTCAKSPGTAPVTFSSVLRLGANRRSRPGDDLNFTSMITEWILSTGGEAARAGKPVQDTEVFPTPDGTHAYKIVALPLSDHQTHVDHVLCHLSRS